MARSYTLHDYGAPTAEAPPPPRADYAPEAGSGPLTRIQKTRLVLLAKQAWERGGRVGDFDTWRNQSAIAACGRRISQAHQRDWGSLKAAYEDAAGDSGRAFNTLMRDQDNPRRIAWYKLTEACRERGLPLAYPEAICRKQYRCPLAEATTKQLWRLFFTVKNRRKEKC